MTKEEIGVRCLGLAHGGTMVCEVISGPENHRGKKAFIPGLIPGEEAMAVINEDKRSFVTASLLSILSPSEQRIVPPCPVFGECGGCDLQYLGVMEQRELKREMVEKTLQRQARLTLPGPVTLLGSDLPGIGYRRRITLHLDEAGQLGFYRQGSAEVVAVSHCMIAGDLLNQTLLLLQHVASAICSQVSGIALEEFNGTGVPLFLLRRAIDARELEALRQLVSAQFPLGKIFYRQDQLSEWHTGLTETQALEFSTLRHFSQINEAGNEVLVAQVVRVLSGEPTVTEFYAGSGNFSFPLARSGRKVRAIEIDRQLVERGTGQAALEGLGALQFIADSTEGYLKKRGNGLRGGILLDPPRSGARALCEYLKPGAVTTVVYVSCALPTLARDLASLVKNGFELVESGIVDMFPQTHHVESITVLRAPMSTSRI